MKITKKILLGFVATAAISTSAISFAEETNPFYVTVGGGALMGTKPSSTKEVDGEVTKFKKPKTGGEFLFGAGYYVMDNVRVEAVFVKPVFGKSKARNYINAQLDPEDYGTRLKPDVNSLQLRGYVDVVDISDMGKLYVGAGLGWSQVKLKFSSNMGSGSSKKTNNLTWLVGLGANFDVADGVKLGAEYNYQDFGKGKFKYEGMTTYKTGVKGHALLGRLMFEI
jgi:opacity protein-like surface antigen